MLSFKKVKTYKMLTVKMVKFTGIFQKYCIEIN